MAHSIPSELSYTLDHEWARAEEGGTVRIGVTSYAIEQLGDVTLIDLPSVGSEVSAGDHFGDIESVKTVSELFAPVGGEIVEVNEELEDQPELINDAPYEGGWMIVIKMSSPEELGRLLDSAGYEAHLGKLED